MTSPRLADQALQLVRLTGNLSRCCQAKEEQLFGKFDLASSEGRVLLVLADSGPSTASSAAEALGLGRSRISPLVENLVRKGFLTRTELAADRRVHTLELTAQGRQVASEIRAFQIEFHEALLRHFKQAERRELLEVLDHLHDAIEEQRGKLHEL